jgi:hypothetical protein
VIAGDAERGSGRHHRHDEAQDAGGVRTTVDEVSEEDRLSSFGVSRTETVARDVVAELGEQRDELVVTTVNVSDDVERAVLGAPVRP